MQRCGEANDQYEEQQPRDQNEWPVSLTDKLDEGDEDTRKWRGKEEEDA